MGEDPKPMMLPPEVAARIFNILETPSWAGCPRPGREGLAIITEPELIDWTYRVADWAAARDRTVIRGDLVRAAIAVGSDQEVVARVWRMTDRRAGL